MEENLLKEEDEYFESKRNELLAKAPGEYALIHGRGLIGIFKCEEDAIRRGYELYGNSPFLVKQILQFDEVLDFTHNFLISA
jgi:hypothetical protein